MPPKRQSTDASGNASKKSKTAADNTDEPVIPRGKRWSKVSASANADDGYRLQISKPEAYAYLCLCKPLHDRGSGSEDEWDEEDEDEDEENANKEKKPACDGGKTCVCLKPAAEHPDQPWVITRAATHKLNTLRIMGSLRDPDGFGMYTYNDHFGYGCVELAQNLILDFEEAKGNWKEQWSVCEGMALFFMKGDADPLFQVDDGESVAALINTLGTMFLTMLSILEREGLLKSDSEIKSLGVVMAAFIRLIAADIGPDFEIRGDGLDNKLLAYAKKQNIELKGLSDIESELEEPKAEAEKIVIPAADANNGDPWAWQKALAAYKKEYGPTIGGDKLDITTWTSAARKKASFDKKDPLNKKMMDAIKEGMIMQPA